MRKISFAFIITFLLLMGMVTVSAEIDSGAPEIKELLPKDENYLWSYWGFVEYGHEMQVSSIIQTENETYYSIKGHVYDASGGEADGDYSLSLSYILNSDVLVQTKQEEMMLDSNFDRIELIRAPLEEGTSWTQSVIDEDGNEVMLESKIINVESDNGHKVYTVRYEDLNSLYYEERQIKENVGVIYFEKLMISEDIDHIDNYEMTYSINEVASGVQTDKIFKDVSDDDWYMEYVPSLASLNIINGYPDGTFQPDGEITVAEFLRLSLASIGYKADSDSTLSFSSYLDTAIALGIIEEGEFADFHRSITREEMVKIMINAIGEEPSDSGELTFEDETTISAEYRGYVEAAVELGVISGFKDNTFRPEEPSKRSQIAKMFYYTVMHLEQKEWIPSDAIGLENEFEDRLFPERDGNRVIAFDTKAELIDYSAEIMDRGMAEGFVENYYIEEEDGLYVIPMDGPIIIFPQYNYQLHMKNQHQYYMTQVLDSEFIGPYKLKIAYEFVEGNWIINDRKIDAHTGEDISVLDDIFYEIINLEDLSDEKQSTIESHQEQRGYIIFEGETENEVILYLGSGEKSTGGYDIHVNAIVNQGNTTKVYVTEKSPDTDEAVPEVITYPKEVVKIANLQEKIEIVTTNSPKMKEIEIE